MSGRSKLTIRLSPDLARSAADGPKPKLTGSPAHLSERVPTVAAESRRVVIGGTLGRAAAAEAMRAEAEARKAQIEAWHRVLKPGCSFRYDESKRTVTAIARPGVRISGAPKVEPEEVDVTSLFFAAEGEEPRKLNRMEHGVVKEELPITGIVLPKMAKSEQPRVTLQRADGLMAIGLNEAMGFPDDRGRYWALPLPPLPEV